MPSHAFFADDLMIFGKATQKSIKNLMDLFRKYGDISGQHLSPSKCHFYHGSLSPAKVSLLRSLLGFSEGSLPFKYLGVPIFVGKPRCSHLLPIVDRIKTKLASWKGHLLTHMGRVQLVRSVVHGMLLHSFMIYPWPFRLIKMLDRYIKNFIWSGDVTKRKPVVVAWHMVCSPVAEGGLGLRSIKLINKAAMLRLAWIFETDSGPWASIARARYLNAKGDLVPYLRSSMWTGVRDWRTHIIANSRWRLGNGSQISFWYDRWLQDPIVVLADIPYHISPRLQARVSDFIQQNTWCIPGWLEDRFPVIVDYIKSMDIPRNPCFDILSWIHSSSGDLSFKEAYTFLLGINHRKSWSKLVWRHSIPPSRSFLFWRFLHDRMPTDDNLRHRGLYITSVCCHCNTSFETSIHLFLECPFALSLWVWLGQKLKRTLDLTSPLTVLTSCCAGFSTQLQDIAIAGALNVVWAIWYSRNHIRFQNFCISVHHLQHLISASVSLSGSLSKGTVYPSATELSILRSFFIKGHIRKSFAPILVTWQPPELDGLKLI